MQTDNRLLDDLTRIATGALGTLQGAKHEVEGLVRQRLETLLNNMDLVTRDEFEAVKAMAVAAREENERLAARVEALEAAAGSAVRPATKRKPTARKSVARKPKIKTAEES